MILHLSRWVVLLLVLLAAPARAADAPAPAASESVTCPECEGEGIAKCEAKGCVRGKVPCPRECLKSTDRWVEMKNPQDPKVRRWLKVPSRDGSTYKLFPDTLIGHLIAYDNVGVPSDGGVCPTCRGTGRADCPECKGTGKVTCPLCSGEKKVSAATAKEFIAKRDEERAARAFVLNDGTVIYGKVVTRMPDKVMIKTDEGKMVEVKPEDIKSEPAPEPKKKPDAKK